jgi:hypothetical protein
MELGGNRRSFLGRIIAPEARPPHFATRSLSSRLRARRWASFVGPLRAKSWRADDWAGPAGRARFARDTRDKRKPARVAGRGDGLGDGQVGQKWSGARDASATHRGREDDLTGVWCCWRLRTPAAGRRPQGTTGDRWPVDRYSRARGRRSIVNGGSAPPRLVAGAAASGRGPAGQQP